MPIHRLVAPLFLLFFAGCTAIPRFINEYKIDVQQGNILTQDMVSQLRPGLSKDQVRFILGTPVLADVFHANRWDYTYRLRKGNVGEVELRRFTVFFDDEGKLARVAGDVEATLSADGGAAAPEARNREIDLGSIDPETGEAPNPDSERGFFGRIWDKIF
ncbi:MAG: outer membrane protein assembly factor BamE [Candidatus Accumulibacter sp.]|jgi:outer membrane protein assembly factor BamE|nr:outer membrane protein assembly factor BamE [Accumulibacter sp.]